jgi:hypothetical protein
MRRTTPFLFGIISAFLFQIPAMASAAEPNELVSDMIHADLPLYSSDWKQLWPQPFEDGKEFGCTSRVGFGDWRFSPNPDGDFAGERWDRFSNYGVFHCAAIFRSAEEREELDAASYTYGYFIQLGTVRQNSVDWELWAIQEGNLPGSQYTLMAREPASGLIDRFRVLQQRCPREYVRSTQAHSIWKTRYCAINSRSDLVSLARAMLKLPPLGTLERVAVEK